jgi:hypothetical protein
VTVLNVLVAVIGEVPVPLIVIVSVIVSLIVHINVCAGIAFRQQLHKDATQFHPLLQQNFFMDSQIF